MVGEWFFSTIAQVTAAVVGFIIAITMVTYSLENERKMSRTAKFRDLLEDFYQSYNVSFDRIQAHLPRSEENNVDQYVFNEYGAENIRNEMFTEEYKNHPVPVQFYCLCLHITTAVFHDLRPGKLEVPAIDTIEGVGNAAMSIQRLLNDDESSRLIYKALTNSNDISNEFMSKPVFDPPIQAKGMEVKSLEDVQQLSSEMVGDYLRIRDRFPAVYAEYTASSYEILNISIYLVGFGALIPLLVTMTPPNLVDYYLSENSAFALQLFLLSTSSILTFALIDLVRVSIKSRGNESPEMRWITRILIQYLPSVF